MTFPHSDQHTDCPLCKQRTVLTDVDYKSHHLIRQCLNCSYHEREWVGPTKIKQWKWGWEDCKSTGLRKVT